MVVSTLSCCAFLRALAYDVIILFTFLSLYGLSVSYLGTCLDLRWLGSAVPAHPNPDTLVLTVAVFAYPRYVQPLLTQHGTHIALRCGDGPHLLLE